jgi:hypothetical protein
MIEGVGSVVREHVPMVIPVGFTPYDAIIEDVDRHIQESIKYDDTRGHQVDADEGLEKKQTKTHKEIVYGFDGQFKSSVDRLVVLMMKVDMRIENRCRKQVEPAMYKIDPAVEEHEAQYGGNRRSFGRGEKNGEEEKHKDRERIRANDPENKL